MIKYFFKIQHIFLWPLFQLLLISVLILYYGLIPSINQIFLGLIFIFILEGLGMSVILHRYFSHNSFKTTRFFQFILGFLGTITNQGSIYMWSSVHNRHHKYCDQPLDPHSWSQTNLVYSWFGYWLYESNINLKYIPKNFKKNELLFLHQFSLFILIAFSAFVFKMSSINTLVFCYWLPSVLATIGTQRFNLLYHPKNSTKACKAVDNPGTRLKIAELMGEGFHEDHHKYSNRAERPGLDLPYHFFLRPLRYLGIIWGLKNNFSDTNT